MNTNRLDIILFPAMLLCFLTSFYYLVEDQFALTAKNTNSIAQVIEMSNTVKTKKVFNYHWVNTKNGDNLQENDQIFTYDDSNAEIKLNSGSKVTVSPNSLISLSSLNKESSINVQKGIIIANLSGSNNKVKINIDGKEVTLNSDNAKVQISKTNKESRIELLSGSATYKIDKDKSSLNTGQQIAYDKNTVSIRNTNLTLSSPSPNQQVISSSKIDFTWKAKGKVIFEISKNINFKKTLKSVSTNKSSLTYKFKEGLYYWRIRNKEEVSTPRPLKVLPLVTTKILSPNIDELIIKDGDSSNVLLTWNDPYYKEFELKIEGPNFNFNKRIIGYSYNLNIDSVGTYKWSVKPVKTAHPYTQANFNLSNPFLPSSPKVSSPKINEMITLFDNSRAQLRWSGNQRSNYELWIAQDKDFKNNLKKQVINGNTLKWRPDSSGRYYLKVREIDLLKRETPSSKLVIFNVDLIDTTNFLPKSGTEITLARPKEKVTFKWKKSDLSKSNRPKFFLEVSKDQNFSNIIITKESFNNSNKITFPELGKYYWRTRVVYPNEEVSFSQPQRVTITPTPAPNKPKINDLDIEIKVNFLIKKLKEAIKNLINLIIPTTHASELNTSAIIEWPKVKNAKLYILEIYKDIELNEVVLTTTLDTNQYNIQGISEGEYFWRIAVIDYWDRQSEFSEISKINFTLPEEYTVVNKVKLTRPKNSATLFGKKALVRFRWSEVPNATKYILLISKDKNFKNIYVKRTRTSNKFNIKLSKSRYYWKIITHNQFNYKSESRTHLFEIKEKKKAPLIVKKQNKVKIKKQTSRESKVYFQYDLASSSYEQQFKNYDIQASDLVFTSIELGNQHYFSTKSLLESRLRRISGKVFDDLDYGLLSVDSTFYYELLIPDFSLGAGISLNKYSSYILNNNTIEDKSNSSMSLPIAVKYHFLTKKLLHEINLKYSFGSLSNMEVSYSLNFWKRISMGLKYENYSSSVDDSNLKLTNIKASLKYHISY